MAGLIFSGARLAKVLERAHQRERRFLAKEERDETQKLTDRIWTNHRAKFEALRNRQAQEREVARSQQQSARRDITPLRAKEHLVYEIENPPPPRPVPKPLRERPEPAQDFNQAADPQPSPEQQAESRAEQIRREMEEWRRKNKDRDHGREM